MIRIYKEFWLIRKPLCLLDELFWFSKDFAPGTGRERATEAVESAVLHAVSWPGCLPPGPWRGLSGSFLLCRWPSSCSIPGHQMFLPPAEASRCPLFPSSLFLQGIVAVRSWDDSDSGEGS